MGKFGDKSSFSGSSNLEERLKRLEQEQANSTNFLNTYTLGTLRTDRTAPTSSADVQTPDKLYDVVRDNNYEYILINRSGTATWVRIIMSTF